MTSRLTGLSPLLFGAAFAMGAAGARAAEVHAFDGITADVFACVVETSAAEHGTRYESSDGLSGTAVTESTLWAVRMGYVFDPVAAKIEYTLLSKSWIVPESAIWPGVEDAIRRCR